MVNIREARGRNNIRPHREAWGSGRLWRRAVWKVDWDFWGDWRRRRAVQGQRLDPGARRAVRP